MRHFILLMAMLSLISCKASMDLQTVEKVDLDSYLGTWYEIARLPNGFEKGLECVTANYSLKENGKIEVLNKGYSKEKKGGFDTAKGTAWVPDQDYPGRLKVTFFWPFSGDYYIIALDEAYTYALVGDPSRAYLWVLSRTKEIDMEIYSRLIEIAEELGFKTEDVLLVNQDCN